MKLVIKKSPAFAQCEQAQEDEVEGSPPPDSLKTGEGKEQGDGQDQGQDVHPPVGRGKLSDLLDVDEDHDDGQGQGKLAHQYPIDFSDEAMSDSLVAETVIERVDTHCASFNIVHFLHYLSKGMPRTSERL